VHPAAVGEDVGELVALGGPQRDVVERRNVHPAVLPVRARATPATRDLCPDTTL
jgi:hypothetical protein